MEMRFLQLSALLVLAACGTSAQTNSQGSVARGRNSSGTEGAANLRATPPPFKQTTIATFDNPWAMAFIPGTRQAIVTEKPGRLYLVDIVTGQKISVSGAPKVVFKRQGGLLDVVLAPGFASNRLIYLTYSEPSANGGSGLALARAKLVDDQNGARIEGLERLWHDPGGGEGGQFGAILVFAPDGKSLFLSSGERQRFTPAQDPSQAIGKILHLTLDGKPAPGNPWAGRSGSQVITLTDPPEDTQVAHHATGRQVRLQGLNLTPSETWSLGHRNPYGLAFAADGRLWETEMGPRGGDELNLILPGRNYGWPIVSQGENYDGDPNSQTPNSPRSRAAQTLLGAFRLSDEPHFLFRSHVQAMGWRRDHRKPFGRSPDPCQDPRKQCERNRAMGDGRSDPVRCRRTGRSDLPPSRRIQRKACPADTGIS